MTRSRSWPRYDVSKLRFCPGAQLLVRDQDDLAQVVLVGLRQRRVVLGDGRIASARGFGLVGLEGLAVLQADLVAVDPLAEQRPLDVAERLDLAGRDGDRERELELEDGGDPRDHARGLA